MQIRNPILQEEKGIYDTYEFQAGMPEEPG